jgi:hypothetical protein
MSTKGTTIIIEHFKPIFAPIAQDISIDQYVKSRIDETIDANTRLQIAQTKLLALLLRRNSKQ